MKLKFPIYEFQIKDIDNGEWLTVATVVSEGLYNLLLPTLQAIYSAGAYHTGTLAHRLGESVRFIEHLAPETDGNIILEPVKKESVL